MGVKVAATCLHWSKPVVSHSSSSSFSNTLASTISSPPSKRRSRSDQAIFCCFVSRSDRLGRFGQTTKKLLRSKSCDDRKFRGQTLRRVISASLDGFSDEEFAEQIHELALRFDLSDDEDTTTTKSNSTDADSDTLSDSRDKEEEESISNSYSSFNEDSSKNNRIIDYVQNPRQFPSSKIDSREPPWLRIRSEPPDWPENDEIVPASIERKANSVDLPLSLRIIKKKQQWKEGFIEAGEFAYCSVKKAFSSMVFIIRELHSYTLQMREILFYEDLEGILVRVQKEMHASFVWLFQQIFSHTPTLMVYVMVLLANFSVYSITNNPAIAVPAFTQSYAATTETQTQNQQQPKFDSSAMKTFSVSSSSSGKTTSIGGNNGGGGKIRPIVSGTDGGDEQFDGLSLLNHHRLSSLGNELESENQRGLAMEDEMKLWISIVEEAWRMHTAMFGDVLDHETIQRFIAPLMVEIEPENYSDYFRTELLYQQAVLNEPNNPLLLSNYAQFLFLVVHDHDRAEEYFKRAIQVKPADAEAISKYANFLWVARKDIGAAEEAYLEALEVDPGNMYYAGSYAHFLWNTGGEDTCFPLNSPSDEA